MRKTKEKEKEKIVKVQDLNRLYLFQFFFSLCKLRILARSLRLWSSISFISMPFLSQRHSLTLFIAIVNFQEARKSILSSPEYSRSRVS